MSKTKRSQVMEQSFRPVLQIMITERNLASWSKSVSQGLQEVTCKKHPFWIILEDRRNRYSVPKISCFQLVIFIMKNCSIPINPWQFRELYSLEIFLGITCFQGKIDSDPASGGLLYDFTPF
jgi:hypothetical protein